jgi:MFS family permease
MYPSVRSAAVLDAQPETDPVEADSTGVSANVVALGFTSFFTDVSSEMVTTILPVYLVFQLGLSQFEFGLFNGVYFGISGLMSVVGGVIADRTQRYKEVAGAGYAVSAGAKLGLLAAGNAPVPASAMLFADRVGKGARIAPRDALISLSSTPSRLATSFGVHRALDTAGAICGPIIAFLILRAAPEAYDAVFVVSFLVALVGLGVLVLFVQNRRETRRGEPSATLRGAVELLRDRNFRSLFVMGLFLGLFTIADAFIYLAFEQESSFQTKYFPLLYVGTAISYVVLAVPIGRLADRVGRARVFLAGYAMLFGAYLLLLGPLGGGQLVVLLATLGAFYACTDGILAAMASTVVARDRRGSGLAVLTTGVALSGFAASLAFGWIWSTWGATATIRLFAVGLAAALVTGAFLLRVRTRRFG